MELIRRTTLVYQAGSSEKVYEVDLCRTGQDRYLVNFRYGRRGATLNEGSFYSSNLPHIINVMKPSRFFLLCQFT